MEFIAELVVRGTPAIRGDRQNMSGHYIKGVVRQNADGEDEVVFGTARPIVSEAKLNEIIGRLHAQAMEVIAEKDEVIAQLQAEVQSTRMQLGLQPTNQQTA